MLAFDTSGDKYAWKQALATASPMRGRCEGSAPLTPPHTSSVVSLAHVSSTGIVLSACQASLKLHVWSAKVRKLFFFAAHWNIRAIQRSYQSVNRTLTGRL